MRKTLMLGTLLVLAILFVNLVIADDSIHIYDTIDANGTEINIDIDIQISGNDTHVREDVYGVGDESDTKDEVLEGAGEDSETELREICSQPSLQQYFDGVGDIPPADFVNYLKALGYDDETHINFIWNLCQHEAIADTQQELTETQGELGELAENIYGTQTGSGPEDIMIGGLEGETIVADVCDNSDMQQYFNELSHLPPSEFREHMKALGYDDETHVNMIWNLCQYKYIQSKEGQWSQDVSGASSGDLVSYIKGAIQWLMSGGQAPDQHTEIGGALDSYFASDYEVAVLGNKVISEIEMLKIRVEALEITMERIAPDEYCEVRIELMERYGLVKVKCGEASTWYYMIPDNSEKGYYIMGITPVNGEQQPESEETTETPICTEKWVCSDWTECNEELLVQLRMCVDESECGTTIDKPIQLRTCEIEEEIEEEPQIFVSPSITAMVVNLQSVPSYMFYILLFVVFPLMFVMFRFRLFVTGIAQMGSNAKLKVTSFRLPRPNVELPLVTITVPEMSLPKMNLPKLKLPKMRMPNIHIPRIHAPKIRAPKIRLPKFNLPKVKAPKVKMPKVRMPKMQMPKIKTPKLQLPKFQIPKVQMPKFNIPKFKGVRHKLKDISFETIRNLMFGVLLLFSLLFIAKRA
jgi:hypothetical protein